MKCITDVDVKGKRILVRVDYNVEIENDSVIDNSRIVASLDTINYLIKNNAKIILLSHLKRITTKEDKEKYSLEPVAKELSKLVNTKVFFAPKTRGKEVETAVNNLKNKEILLIENTRFEDYPDELESSCNSELSKYWSSLADIFVLDAFASSHRAHASTYGISDFIPSYAGMLVFKEKQILDRALENDNFTLIMGGVKVKDKIGTIDNLITKADKILLGGALCFTFLKANNINIGSSPYEEEYINYAREILNKYNNKIILPTDLVTSMGVRNIHDLTEEDVGYDIGPATIETFINNLKDSKLVLWNGPLGKYEEEDYEYGTRKILEYLQKEKLNETILAGGDILTASTKLNVEMKHISTGGGASLEYLSGVKFKTFENLK